MQRSNKQVAKFYQTKQWDKVRRAYKIYRHGLCERCGQPRLYSTPQRLYNKRQHIQRKRNTRF